MLDYHLHLWPHEERDPSLSIEQLAAYCERARAAGVVEVAVTEHLFRFSQARPLIKDLFEAEDAELRRSMRDYWDYHARNDLDAYVECGLEAKAAGLPVVLGLEVDYYRGRMDEVSMLLAGYPFDVLLGSVHWIGAWRFDDIGDEVSMREWSVRDVDSCWDAYADAIEELAVSEACDVIAHPDLIKAAGHQRSSPEEWWDRMAEVIAGSNMSAELSSAGWRKPVGEQYPAQPLLVRLAAKGVPITTASDAHRVDHVADRADELRSLLASIGVHELTAFRQRVPHRIPLGTIEKERA